MKRTALTILVTALLAGAAAADITIANDPSYIAVGTRTLGMGKAYAGVADDLLSIFINPAGLAYLPRWQATSLTSKFINEYDYVNAAVAFPYRAGSIGLALVGSGLSFHSPSATIEVRDGVRFVPSTTEGYSYSYGNNMALLSFGLRLGEVLPWDWAEHLSAGATWKSYLAYLSGPGVAGGNARGNEVDLGLHYRPNAMVRLGATLQNALPFSAGGKIKWDSGAEDALPAVLKSGLSFKVIGQDGWRQADRHQLYYNIDLDYYPSDTRLPNLLHQGFEWIPMENIDLRLGFDQDYVGLDEVGKIGYNSNLTVGVGVYHNDFRFDYAYHQYNAVANDTHYFSLSYGFPRGQKELAPFTGLYPADQTINFTQEALAVGGVINDPRIERVIVNGVEAVISGSSFEAWAEIKLGKNPLWFEGLKEKGDPVGRDRVRLLSLKGFSDVEPAYWAAVPIGVLAMEQVITGYPDGTFKPEGNITRAEFATLLMKTRGEREVLRTPGFKDVGSGHWAAPFIALASDDGVVKGYPDGTFRPRGLVTRAEGVAMIARFAGLPAPKQSEKGFIDLPARHWAVKEVSQAYEAGILHYLKGKDFQVNRPLIRSEVAEMLSKAPPLSDKVRVWLDWEVGYQ